MSSAIYVTFDEDEGVKGSDWAAFCREHAIRYSPQTVGQSTFYVGEVEICFGRGNGTEPAKVPDPQRPSGWRYDWDTAKPPDYAEEVTFRTVYGTALEQLAELARMFWLHFGGAVSADETLRHLFAPGATPSRVVAVGAVVRDRDELAARKS